MKLIIAGGRDYNLTSIDFSKLDMIHIKTPVTRVVSGKATGADASGERWAKRNGIQVDPFPAPWDDVEGKPESQIGTTRYGKKYWKLAGPYRNAQMAAYADAVALFPGGSGTRSMLDEARKAGIIIFDYRSK